MPISFPIGNVRKVIDIPANKRLFYSHLHELAATKFNRAYMTYWVNHYSSLLPGQDWSGALPISTVERVCGEPTPRKRAIYRDDRRYRQCHDAVGVRRGRAGISAVGGQWRRCFGSGLDASRLRRRGLDRRYDGRRLRTNGRLRNAVGLGRAVGDRRRRRRSE